MQDLAAAYTDPHAGVSTTVDVQQVRIPARRVREKRHDPASLAESIAEVGLMNPITVNSDLTLIAGFRRLEAVKLLGWTQVAAVVLDLDPVMAEVAEIDENLRRSDLTVWEQSKHIARREELLAGQRAGRGDNRYTVDRPDTVTGLEPKTTADLAAQAGISERTYQRRAKVGSRITPEVAAVIDDIDPESSSLPDSTRQLDYLAGVDDPQDQLDIVARVADGTARDVFEASTQLKQERQPHVSHNSGENEWYTPPQYIAAARQALGTIDLDPASSDFANTIVQASRYYTIDTDGLAQDWAGAVWMNPPYSGDLVSRFITKFCEHWDDRTIPAAVLLVNNATETGWFQELLLRRPSVCFPKGRIRYLDKTGTQKQSPLQGQAFLYFGPDPASFRRYFEGFGAVL